MHEIPGEADSIGNSETDDSLVAARRRRLNRVGLGILEIDSMQLSEGLRVEELDGELVLLDVASNAVHRVTGDGVAAVRLLQGGVPTSEVPEHLLESVQALADAGLVSGNRRVSRRKAIGVGGAAWAAATVTTFVLADPAAAWSVCRNGKTPTANDAGSSGKKYTTAGTYTWVSGPSGFHTPNTQQNYNILVRAWGGGGGGGNDGYTLGGGGGGGGAYASSVLSVTECTEYTIVVGAGGASGSTDGGISTFGSAATLKADSGKKGINAVAFDAGDGGAGGTVASSVGTTKFAGGSGGGGGSFSDTGTGGGSAGSTGNGGNGNSTTPGAAGSGSPGGAKGGDDEDSPAGIRNGLSPGGGGAGSGGIGAPGAVWVGV